MATEELTHSQSNRPQDLRALELFDPGSNPFEDEPFYWFPRGEDTRFVRMTVDPCRD